MQSFNQTHEEHGINCQGARIGLAPGLLFERWIMKSINTRYIFELPKNLYEALEAESKKTGLSKADLTRLALRNLLKSNDHQGN